MRSRFWSAARSVLFITPMFLAGCQLFAYQQEMRGRPVDAQYGGLANKSVGIFVYADQATTNEFPSAREEISAFIAGQMREHVPSARLLDYREVLRWQDDTINWFGLTEKQMGQHFGVDRVLYIEMLDYSVSQNKGFGDLQGHIRANCKVVEVDNPASSAQWQDIIDVRFPEDRPADPTQTNSESLRAECLKLFADKLVKRFYDHHEFDTPDNLAH